MTESAAGTERGALTRRWGTRVAGWRRGLQTRMVTARAKWRGGGTRLGRGISQPGQSARRAPPRRDSAAIDEARAPPRLALLMRRAPPRLAPSAPPMAGLGKIAKGSRAAEGSGPPVRSGVAPPRPPAISLSLATARCRPRLRRATRTGL